MGLGMTTGEGAAPVPLVKAVAGTQARGVICYLAVKSPLGTLADVKGVVGPALTPWLGAL